MRKFAFLLVSALLLLAATRTSATIFGAIRGIAHDPQHRPIADAMVQLKAANSDFSLTTQTNQDGEFTFNPVALGDYTITIGKPGFAQLAQSVTLASDTSPVFHFELPIAAVEQTATVTASAEVATASSVTPTTLVSRENIAQTPGADQTNSLAIVTDFVPGAYFTHDMLHIRGGHQVSWLIDGVPIPNTNIASNLGPQIDPKNMDYLEALRGSYDADYGDRTFGVFNVVPRNGFARNTEAELVTSFGNFYQTNDQFDLGSHTENFAYYLSVDGNRSNLGLQAPIGQVFHDAENGYGGFASLIYNRDPKDQFRLVTSLRKDYYQIPYDPYSDDWESQLFNSSGLRDGEHESDAYVDFSWIRTFNPNTVLTVSPFYHYNTADYQSFPNDYPIATTQNQDSNYGGAQATVNISLPKNELQAGVYGFGQHENQLFGAIVNDMSGPNFIDTEPASGGLAAGFVDDKFKPIPWLTLMAGMRPTHFSGQVSENAISPRLGVAVLVPHLDWVFRAFYGDYYQAPPLLTISGPQLIDFVLNENEGLGFIPLHGERDEESQFGVTIPVKGWTLDADTFKTHSTNFLDHSNVGESNIFFPITWQGALIRAWELTIRSPRLWNRGQLHLAYSNQIAESAGGVTGGLICPEDVCVIAPGYSPLDHDQRNTLNVGATVDFPWQSYASTNVYYGSGFTNGEPNQYYPGDYLPSHTTFDLTLGKSFGERYSVSVTSLNVTNRRVLLDNSLTFGGFHYNNPREIYVEFRYRFHY